MDVQKCGYVSLASRMFWSPDWLAMRLGLMMPVEQEPPRWGGRVPLTGTEVETFARVLRVPVEQLVA